MTDVCLAMLVKDEAASIVEVLSAAHQAGIKSFSILDTGSTDGTQDLVQAWAKEHDAPLWLHAGAFVDFSTSRNEMLELAAERATWTIWLSGDEFLHGTVDLAGMGPLVDAVNVQIRYGNLAFDSPRIVRSKAGWRFVGAVHEVLMHPDRPPTSTRLTGVYVEHRTSDVARKNDGRYRQFEALHRQHEQDPSNARCVFYLAQTCGELGMHEESLRLYERRVALGGWAEEVYEAMYRCGIQAENAGIAWADCLEFYERAYLYSIANPPVRAEPYYRIALRYKRVGMPGLAKFVARGALEIPYPAAAKLFVEHAVYETELAAIANG